MTIGKKLLGGTLTIVAVSAVSGYFTSRIIGQVRDLAASGLTRATKTMDSVGTLNTRLAMVRFAQRGVLLYTLAADAGEVATQQKRLDGTFIEIRANLAELRPLVNTPGARLSLDKFEAALNLYEELSREVVADSLAGRTKDGIAVLKGKSKPVGSCAGGRGCGGFQPGTDLGVDNHGASEPAGRYGPLDRIRGAAGAIAHGGGFESDFLAHCNRATPFRGRNVAGGRRGPRRSRTGGRKRPVAGFRSVRASGCHRTDIRFHGGNSRHDGAYRREFAARRRVHGEGNYRCCGNGERSGARAGSNAAIDSLTRKDRGDYSYHRRHRFSD